MQLKKLLFTALSFTLISVANAQMTDAFRGAGDVRYQIGANFQKNGTGIMTTIDYGLGPSFSFGLQGGYLLGVKVIDGLDKPGFGDRFDLKGRANAHLGEVMGLPSNFDIYPGLNLGLKNFGAHLGTRVFFENGFGLFAEGQFPIARYNKEAANYQLLNNQFNFSIGASFDLSPRPMRLPRY